METTEVVPAQPETPAVAPAPVETASTEAAPVSGDSTPEEKPAKTFTQAELDAIVAKEKARVERKVRRELTAVTQPTVTPSNEPQKPVISDFTTVDDYDRAMTEWSDKRLEAKEANKAKESQAAQEAREAQQRESAYADREEAVLEKYPDYHQVTRNPNLPITTEMARVIQESDQGPEVAYYLGKNPQEAARIAQLSPFLQAKEIGRIEAKLSLPAPKKTSSAPEPITPVTPNGGGGYVIDTTDAKASEKVLSQPGGTTAWINAERERQRKALEQRNR